MSKNRRLRNDLSIQEEICCDIQKLDQGQVLVDRLDPQLPGGLWVCYVDLLTVNGDPAARWSDYSGDAVDQSRFPSAVIAEQSKDLSGKEAEADLGKGLDRSECFREVVDFQRRTVAVGVMSLQLQPPHYGDAGSNRSWSVGLALSCRATADRSVDLTSRASWILYPKMELRTIASQVADRLRAEILGAQIVPGSRLLQDEEAARLGVSRTPVREAFKQLEAERLIELIPNRGAVVREFSAGEIRELYLIRSHLESLATSQAAQKMTAEELAELQEVLRSAERLSPSDDRVELLRLNKEFHFRIYGASRLPRLVAIISSLWGPIEAVRAAYVSLSTMARHATDEHRLLYEALQRRDPVAAGDLTRRHILATADVVVGWMETPTERGAEGSDRLSAQTA